MIEVLVTLVVLTLGLLGLAGLQARLQSSEIESYQRSQALVLVSDMASRLSSNRSDIANYVTTTALGIGNCPAVSGTPSRKDLDLREWCLALKGAAENQSGNAVGAMSNALGCVTTIGGNNYRVAVTWQGVGALPSDPDALLCTDSAYGTTRRRALVSVVTIGTL
jgi:type IV pilus assembly protein PilV